MRSWVLLVLAACGSKQPTPPVVAQQPPAPAPLVASCADAGVILRGPVSSGDEQAGHAREQAIEKSCRDDKWSQAVIDCIAGTTKPQDCLEQLGEDARGKYDERLQAWDESYGGDAYGADGTYHMQPAVVDCSDILDDVSNYAPVLDGKAAERAWQVKVRKAWLGEVCEHDWPDELKSCINGAMNERVAIEACIEEHQGADKRDELTRQLADFGELAKKMDAAKKKPTSIGCKQVVAAHYADAKWKGKLDGYKAAERKKMIAESRTVMTKACTADSWDDTIRACLVSGGSDACFDDANKRKWGYPATGAVTSVGVTECDAYSTKVLTFASCTKVAQLTRDSIVRSQQQMLAEIARMPQAERAKTGTSCQAAMEAIELSLTNAGC